MEFLIEFNLFSWLFSGLDAWQCWHWQIKDKKLINKGTGRKYSYDPSKKGYDLGNGMIIEASDKWKFCRENNDSFKIKCTTTGSFLKANYDLTTDWTTSGTGPNNSYRFWADLLHKWSFLGYDWHPWIYTKCHAYLIY